MPKNLVFFPPIILVYFFISPTKLTVKVLFNHIAFNQTDKDITKRLIHFVNIKLIR